MAEAPRSRRKAVVGLKKLPATEREWREMAVKHNLANAKLQDLCSSGRFSASTVPKEAFLTIRCIWPDMRAAGHALQFIRQTNSFFNDKHVDSAHMLFNKGLLGLDKLDTLFDIICCSEAKTPRESPFTIAHALGPFSMLIPLLRQIMDKERRATPEDESNPITYAPKTRRHYDLSQSSSDASLSDSPTASRPNQPSTDELPDEIPEPRTPTETLVVDFMVNFIGGITCSLQRLASYAVCVANAFETTYQFGPISNPADKIQFRAHIDGSIPFSSPADNNMPEMVMFEAKCAPHEPGESATVRGQQSMEHVAYIWQRHEKNRTSISPGTYHTFMIALDYLSFSISIGTYNDQYLAYIFGLGDAPVIPSTHADKGFLHVQEFGPFQVDERKHMKFLLHIILSLMIWQLNGKKEGLMIQEALAEADG
ncbi:hypothetical protein FQN50_001717 [Emmonsiellopsis sp. PD_5]|nr:hypothetical protein FQN50_001717 [Emmonsiellopsis sp. PD_5]